MGGTTSSPTTSTDSPTTAPSVSLNPSSLPSLMPSGIPSLIPSVVPSVLPSRVPSSDPSLLPSSKPSVVPSVDCTQSDDDEFLYKVKNNDKVVTKTCGWLANKSKSKKKKICRKTVAHTIEYAPPQVTSKIVCNSCHPCYENSKSKWFYKKKKDGEVKLKTCSSLAKNTEKEQLCDDRTATNGGYSGPAVHCPVTCGVGSCEA